MQIGFYDGPYYANPGWTDVTSYVREITTSRGRSDDWQNFDTGNATVVLDNRDRRFDPTYTAGPYYTYLQPRRQILIDATTNGSTYYDIFRGYVDGWPVELTDANLDSTVTLSCYDALGLISQEQAPFDWSDTYIRTTINPNRYWKLDDFVNPANIPTTAGTLSSFVLKDYGTDGVGLSPVSVSTPTQNITSLAKGIPTGGIAWPNNYAYLSTVADTYTYTSGAYACWFQPAGSSTTPYQETFWNGVAGSIYTNSATFTSTGFTIDHYLNTSFGSTTRYVWSASIGMNLSVPHHFAVSWTGLGASFTPTVLVDGVTVPLTSSTSTASASWELGYRLYGTFQQVLAVRGSTLSTTVMRTLYQYGNNVYSQTTADRFATIMANSQLPASLQSCTTTPAGTVGALTVGGAFINNELQLTSDSEGGELYTSRSGVLTMTNRTYYQSSRSANSQATFGVGGLPIQTEMSYYWTAEGIRNKLDVNWTGDTNVTVSDATSIAAYGTSSDTYTTVLTTLADATSLANQLVAFGKLPRLIMSAVEVGQALSTAQWNTTLGLDLLDRITVVIDEAVGSDLSQTQLIQQIEHRITPGDWRTTILGSSRWSSVFTIGTSYLDGNDILG